MKSTTETRSALVVLDTINLIFLLICCSLLIRQYRSKLHKDPQQLFIINLASSEFLANMFLLVRDIVNLIRPDSQTPSNLHNTFWCLNMAFVTGVSYIYILARFFVTGDRLMHIVLSPRYDQYWDIRRTWKVLGSTWICNVFLSIALSLLTYYNFDYIRYEGKISRVMAVYVLTGIYTIFLLFVCFAYGLMFLIYSQSKRKMALSQRTTKPSLLTTFFVKSRFSRSFVLVFTYLLLTVIPSLTRSIYYIAGYNVPYLLTFCYLISTRISYTVDGIIYILLQKEIRNVLQEMFSFGKASRLWRHLKCSDRTDTDTETSTEL